MIISDLYTTQQTLTYTQPNTKMTEVIPNIPISSTAFTGAYWLGWISYDNLPQVFKTSQLHYEGTGATRKVKFADVTRQENVDFTYFGTHSTSYNNGNYSVEWVYFRYDATNTKWTYSSYYGYPALCRLINDMEFQSFGMGTIDVQFALATDQPIGNYSVRWSTGVNATFTMSEFLEFMAGERSVSYIYTDSYTSQTVTLTVTGTDFENGLYSIDEHYTLFINHYVFNKKRRNVYNSYDNIVPVINTHITTDNIQAEISTNRSQNPTGNYALFKFKIDTSTETLTGNFFSSALVVPEYGSGTGNERPVSINGIDAEFALDDLLDYTTYPKINGNAVIGHNSEQINNQNFSLLLYPVIKLQDIYRHAALYRWVDTNYSDPGYSDGHIYYPKVNTNTNEILCELITGGQEIIAQLAPWEYSTILSNTYTEDDKPTPTPPTPEGEDTTEKHNDENSLPVISGIRTVSGDAFSTFYDVSMYHVAALGSLLSQMPSTFWEALGTATDYKQANILDYLVSLKWYPLAIADASDTQTTYIQFGFNGVSKIDLSAVSGTTKKLNDVNRIYHMGSVTVPYRHTQQTFLDLEPYTSVSAYLPYIGTVALQSNDVVGYTITCTYIVDLTTGMCTGILDNGVDTIYIGTGKIGVDISVSGNDILTQSEKMASSYLGAATGAVNNVLSLGSAVASENVVGAAGAAASGIADLATSAISIANSKRGIPETVGAASGFGGGYTHQTPYIKVLRPAVSIPASYGHDVGYVCNKNSTIGALSGYTVCQNPDLSGIPATAAELDMIRSILCSGFYA